MITDDVYFKVDSSMRGATMMQLNIRTATAAEIPMMTMLDPALRICQETVSLYSVAMKAERVVGMWETTEHPRLPKPSRYLRERVASSGIILILRTAAIADIVEMLAMNPTAVICPATCGDWVLAIYDGIIVGMMVINTSSPLSHPYNREISRYLFVNPSHRRQGVGTCLIEEALSRHGSNLISWNIPFYALDVIHTAGASRIMCKWFTGYRLVKASDNDNYFYREPRVTIYLSKLPTSSIIPW